MCETTFSLSGRRTSKKAVAAVSVEATIVLVTVLTVLLGVTPASQAGTDTFAPIGLARCVRIATTSFASHVSSGQSMPEATSEAAATNR